MEGAEVETTGNVSVKADSDLVAEMGRERNRLYLAWS